MNYIIPKQNKKIEYIKPLLYQFNWNDVYMEIFSL